jgi:hypothetical protein
MKKSSGERRQELIEALVEDKTSQFVSNGKTDIEDVVRSGFIGFESMGWDQLVQCAYDANLPKRDAAVRALVERGAS